MRPREEGDEVVGGRFLAHSSQSPTLKLVSSLFLLWRPPPTFQLAPIGCEYCPPLAWPCWFSPSASTSPADRPHDGIRWNGLIPDLGKDPIEGFD